MSRFDMDADRHATDSGPMCPGCKMPDGVTIWIYVCQSPYREVQGMTCCCKTTATFPIPPHMWQDNGSDIQTIKSAHRIHLDSLLTPEQYKEKYGKG